MNVKREFGGGGGSRLPHLSVRTPLWLANKGLYSEGVNIKIDYFKDNYGV